MARDKGQGEIIHHYKQNILNFGKLPELLPIKSEKDNEK